MRPSGFSPEAINSAREIQPLLLSSNPFSPSHEVKAKMAFFWSCHDERKWREMLNLVGFWQLFLSVRNVKRAFGLFCCKAVVVLSPLLLAFFPPPPPPPGQAKRENES